MLRLFASIEEDENTLRAPWALKAFEWDAVRAVVTQFDATQQAEMAALMQAYLVLPIAAPPRFHR